MTSVPEFIPRKSILAGPKSLLWPEVEKMSSGPWNRKGFKESPGSGNLIIALITKIAGKS
jgi:hypothetical protein